MVGKYKCLNCGNINLKIRLSENTGKTLGTKCSNCKKDFGMDQWEFLETLQTLKDIEFDKSHFIIEQYPIEEINMLGIEELEKNAVSRITLRQEAIKQAKEMLLSHDKGRRYKVQWIKYFFNLTSEDLK